MKFPRIFPTWPVTDNPSDTRKWVAELVSFGGGLAMSAGAVMMVYIIWKGVWTPDAEPKRLEILGYATLMLVGGTIANNLAFGFVITPRKYKIGKDGLEAEGGDVPAPEVKTTTTTTATLAPAPKPAAPAAVDERD